MTIHLALVDGRMRDETSTGHLSTEHLAAFLDGRLTGADRERAVRHFAGCAACRSELTELRDLLPGSTSRSRRWVAAAAVAAALVALVMIPQIGNTPDDSPARVRTESRLAEGSAREVVSPAERASASPVGVELTWRSIGVGAAYTVTVQDSSGSEVWKRTSAPDTSVRIPANTDLRPGRLYFWSVDARLADGTSAKTGARTFTVR